MLIHNRLKIFACGKKSFTRGHHIL